MNIYRPRIERLCRWMEKEKIDAVVIEDAEDRRNSSLRYLSGLPSDGVLIVLAEGKSILLPWDMILAERMASADEVVSYNDYNRNPVEAVAGICGSRMGRGRIELIDRTPYTLYKEIADKLEGFELVCRTRGLADCLQEMRGVKDEREIEIYRRAGEMTNRMIDSICAALEDGGIKTEVDAAMFVESESRRLGAEGSSFETLAAGPARSWGIHAFPAFTAGAITGTAAGLDGGLSIIDCGLKLEGLCTDITLTICTGSLSSRQAEMTDLVAGAHKLAAATAVPGVSAASVARAVDGFFKDAGCTMPHGLGHGLGLDVHEYPYLKDVEIYDKPLLPGMVFTIEPGLYDSEAGGVRLENDYLMTENGAEALTASRILRLPRD